MIGLVKRLEKVPGAPAAPQIRQDIIQHKKVNPSPEAAEKARLVNETTIFWDTYYKLKSRYEGDPSKGKTKMGAGSPAAAAVGTAGAALAGTAAVAGGAAAGGGGMGLWGMLLTAGGLWLALKLLKKNPKVKAALEDIGGMMWDKVKEGWEWFKTQFPAVGEFLEGTVEKVKDIWEGIKKQFPDFFAWVEKFQTKMGEIWDDLGEGAKSIWEGIKKKYEDIKNSVSDFFSNVGGIGDKVTDWVLNMIDEGGRRIAKILKSELFDPVLDELAFMIDQLPFISGVLDKRLLDQDIVEGNRAKKTLDQMKKMQQRSIMASDENASLILKLKADELENKRLHEVALRNITRQMRTGEIGPKEGHAAKQGEREKNKIALEEFRKRIQEEQELRKKAGLEMVKLDDFRGLAFGNKIFKINRGDEIMGAKAGGPISRLLSRNTGGSAVANTIANQQLHEAKRTNTLLEGLVLVAKSLSKVGGGVSAELASLLDTLAKSQAMGNISPQGTQFDDTGPLGEPARMTSSRLAYYQSPHSLNTPLPWGSA